MLSKKYNFLFTILAPSLLFFTFSLNAFSTMLQNSRHIPYYGESFYQIFDQKGQALGEEIRQNLNRVLNDYHVTHKDQYDEIISYCDSRGEEGCYSHRVYDYTSARKILFNQLHLEQGIQGHFIKDVYCQKDMTKKDFPAGQGSLATTIPSHTVLNVEHTWPQSRFNLGGRYTRLMQKTDLHHLYPAQSKINGIRGHQPFGEVERSPKAPFCEQSALGVVADTTNLNTEEQHELFFQPPPQHRGNVARALFYFAVKYETQISPTEEKFLKKWDKEDPVDAEERARNEKIFSLQGTRNPFIDYPELADTITDF